MHFDHQRITIGSSAIPGRGSNYKPGGTLLASTGALLDDSLNKDPIDSDVGHIKSSHAKIKDS